MAQAIQLSVDDRELRRNIRALGDREIGRVMAKALNRTAFEVLDAEKDEVGRRFAFAGASTRRFMAGRGSFRFDKATEGELEARIMPAPKNADLLEEHVRGATIRGGPGRLSLGRRLAVPVEAKRSARGRVAQRRTPGQVIRGDRSRAFVAGDAILERTGPRGRGGKRAKRGRGRSKLRVLYALEPSATLRRRFDFFGTAAKAAQAAFTRKAREEFRKLRFGK